MKRLTVQEAINKLSKIEDKSKDLYVSLPDGYVYGLSEEMYPDEQGDLCFIAERQSYFDK